MIALKNKSEITLAVEGARGPPEGKKRNLFLLSFQMPLFLNENEITYRGAKMNNPKTIKAGFKTPPLVDAQGRGPPERKKREPFFDLSL